MGYYVDEWNLETIKSFSDPLDDCCIWRGGKHKQGYGMMRYNNKMRTVHSVIAELKYGIIPTKTSGTRATRTCDNLACCNPDHIIIESASVIQINAKPSSKRILTQEQAREIRAKYRPYGWGAAGKLAKEYNVTTNLVYSIAHNRTYKEREK